jgi:plasmid stabilization system protein ParE
VWSPEAIEDLASLRAYIAEDNPAAARRVMLQIIETVEQLLSEILSDEAQRPMLRCRDV